MDIKTHTGFTDLLEETEEFMNLDHTNYYYFEKGFSEDECKMIIENFKTLTEQSSMFIGVNETYRSSNNCWIPYNPTTSWIYDRIIEFAAKANKRLYNFDVTSLRDMIQFTEYSDTNKGKYDEHVDIGKGPYSQRKLSVSVQLSDPEDYDGGQLIIRENECDRKRGTVCIFPSFLEHRVAEVTRGTRYSMVLWIYGPAFK